MKTVMFKTLVGGEVVIHPDKIFICKFQREGVMVFYVHEYGSESESGWEISENTYARMAQLLNLCSHGGTYDI